MTFKEWLALDQRLAPKSVSKYDGAVRHTISQWAMENGLIGEPLTSIRSPLRFNAIATKIRALPIYQEWDERGNRMYHNALDKFAKYLSETHENDVEDDIDVILSTTLSETEKSALVKCRIGQGTFREELITYWKGECAVTGFKDINLLVASHIKPWKHSTNGERLDTFNGLLLIPNLDKAFDAGLVTFSQEGQIQVSPLLTTPKVLGIHAKLRVSLDRRHVPFMDFHRNKVYHTR